MSSTWAKMFQFEAGGAGIDTSAGPVMSCSTGHSPSPSTPKKLHLSSSSEVVVSSVVRVDFESSHFRTSELEDEL